MLSQAEGLERADAVHLKLFEVPLAGCWVQDAVLRLNLGDSRFDRLVDHARRDIDQAVVVERAVRRHVGQGESGSE